MGKNDDRTMHAALRQNRWYAPMHMKEYASTYLARHAHSNGASFAKYEMDVGCCCLFIHF